MSELIKTLIQSKNPNNGSKLWYRVMYNQDDWGGKITPNVKIQGDCFIPFTSYVSGRCVLKDVKIPHNTGIISLSVHEKHEHIGKIGDFELVRDLRVARGVYVSGLVRKEEHIYLNARTILGYDLHVYGRSHCSNKVYNEIQKTKRK